MIVAYNSPNNFKRGLALESEGYGLLGLSSMMASALALARHTTLMWLIRRQDRTMPEFWLFFTFLFSFWVHLHSFYLHCIFSRSQQRQAVPVPSHMVPRGSLRFFAVPVGGSPLIGNKAAEWGGSSLTNWRLAPAAGPGRSWHSQSL